MSRLLIVAADGSKRAVTLSDNTIRIGRSAGNDVVLPDAAKGVSRTHAELRYDNGRFLIVDLNSQNGTWLNGRRIEQAEVARDSEIVLGTYHLRLQDTWEDDTVPIPLDGIAMETPRPRLAPAAPTAELDEIVLVRSQAAQPNKRRGGRGSSYSRKLILAGAIAIMCLAALAWVFGFNRSQEGSLDVAAAPSTSHAEASSTPPSPQASAPNAVAPRLVSNATQPPATGDASPVVRLAETTDTTTARHTAELAARYANARTALERGDFGAAARAFDAIVGEDASYRDASQLLSRARTAQRAADVFATGKRLDAAGEWIGALQKYDQAHGMYADVPGLAEAARQVRGKLRVAGTAAFKNARQFDTLGQSADAIKEYEKAVQWLPPADPNRMIAMDRVNRLRKAAH